VTIDPTVGITPPPEAFGPDPIAAHDALERLVDAGVAHVHMGDHVSFYGGFGLDGLLRVTILAARHPSIEVATAVYLLPLRHPLPVARQLTEIAQLAPGRFTFGVGVGGEDPHEVEVCGVDPRTRGRRCDESLEIITRLLAGETVTFEGRVLTVTDARITPLPPHPIPIVVGGRSDAALRRAGRFGVGWMGIWNSVDRFTDAVGIIAAAAAEAGRSGVAWQHQMFVWCGVGDDRDAARAAVARAMEGIYQLPFERFERYVPYGSPEEIADFLAPYAQAGSRRFHLSLVAAGDVDRAAVAGRIRQRLEGVGR
jgi:alkanesulfonate monooxygenase SsuD/methylene tetrahydromethanopterin reductase-like flavin-dependent oxidoreductase (luciferase family)